MGLYERLREEHGAVAPVLIEGDLPAWLVLGYRENLEVLRAPHRFSRDSRLWPPFQQGRVPADYPLLPVLQWQPLCVFADGEEHERLRTAITESMDRFRGRGVRRQVERFAHQLIDAFCTQGEADLISQFAAQLPLLTATRLFGMPDSYGPRLLAACRDLMQGTPTSGASNAFLLETMRALVVDKRHRPDEDLASWLITHPSKLTDDEVAEHLRFALLAANENPIILIGSALHMMLTDRRFRASLAGMQMTLADAVEQLLWDRPPLFVLPGRWATGDTELAGRPIKKGDMLLLGLAAGNTDPQVRPDAELPMHGNRSHLSFGRGSHECPGQDLGRVITETAIDTLLTRLPDLNLAVEEKDLRWASSWMYRQLAELPVTFQPRKPAARRGTAPTPPPVPQAEVAGTAAGWPQGPAALPADPETLWQRVLRQLRKR